MHTSREKKRSLLAEKIANYLDEELKKRGMTQAEFAERIGCSDRQVRRWLKGDIHRIETIEEIAKVLHVEIGQIVSFGNDLPNLFI